MNKIRKIFKIKNKNTTYTFKELLIVTIFVTLIVSTITGFVVYKVISSNELIKLESSYNKIKNEYYSDINKEELENAAIDGMMKYLNEKYSLFMDQEETSSLNDKLDGNYDGIGIEIGIKDKKIMVLNVYENTPASIAGLKVNDELVKVEDLVIDESTTLKDVTSLIKDKKSVKLSIKRDNEVKEFNIDIKKIDKPVVTEKVFERNNKKVGYIYLSTFSENAGTQVKEALKKLDKENIDGLIFDVRSNTGGYLTSVTEILNMFLKKGHLMYSLEEKDKKKMYYDTTKEEYDKDVVVLIDRKTASASEILASSLKESYGATIVGTTSYGKGKVQSTYKLSKDTMLKYTTAKWYTPNGNSIDEVGITPGIYVTLGKEYVLNPCDETDSQLQKAVDLLTQ